MAASLQDWTDFQNDLMTQYQTLFGFSTPLYAELTGAQLSPGGVATRDPSQERITPLTNAGRDRFIGGAEIRVPIQVAEVPGAAGVGRGGTWPVTAPMDTAKATLKLCEIVAPIGLDLALERDAQSGVYNARSYVETLTESAYRNLAKTENDMLHGAGDGLLAAVTGASGSPGLTIPVGTDANFDQLTPGRVVSIFTRSSGANPGNGNRRKIVSVDRSAGTVTFDTNAVADDGDSGNITFSNTSGIYIDSTWDQASANGKAMQGLGQVVTVGGTPFEGIDVDDVGSWSAVSVDGGAAALSDDAIDEAVYLLAGNGQDAPDFGIAHPRTVDPYKAAKTQFLMIQPQTKIVPSGFQGIVYQGANKEFPILKDLAAPRKTCRLVTKAACRVYGDNVGPAFIQDDGGMWRFFDRRSYKEATIMDRPQLVVENPAHLAEISNLAE